MLRKLGFRWGLEGQFVAAACASICFHPHGFLRVSLQTGTLAWALEGRSFSFTLPFFLEGIRMPAPSVHKAAKPV